MKYFKSILVSLISFILIYVSIAFYSLNLKWVVLTKYSSEYVHHTALNKFGAETRTYFMIVVLVSIAIGFIYNVFNRDY